MRHRLVKRSLVFAALHLLAFGVSFAVASPMLNVDREPTRVAIAASRVMLALLQPTLSAAKSLPIAELPLILVNSLSWGVALSLTLGFMGRLVKRAHRA